MLWLASPIIYIVYGLGFQLSETNTKTQWLNAQYEMDQSLLDKILQYYHLKLLHQLFNKQQL